MALASGKWLRTASASAAAAALLLLAFGAHLNRACTVEDTPYLPICPDAARGESVKQSLHTRLAANPGDSWAWTGLLIAQAGVSDSPVLQAAATLSPNHGAVLRRRAAEALQRGDAAEGVNILVQMVARRRSTEAAQALAHYLTTPESAALLRPHVATSRDWLPAVLGQLGTLKIAANHALPLVAEAMERDALQSATWRSYMRSLKTGGYWLDAYGLWLMHQKKAVPLLYNASFDDPVQSDGFDWEFASGSRSRAGVLIHQRAVARRGLVLEFDFTGRSFARPITRQHVFAPAGTYRLQGEYMASKLRSEAGLTWQVVCTSGQKTPLAGSPALVDTGGIWKPWRLDFTVPSDCGTVVSVQLEPAATFEAKTGIRGRLALDNLSLSPIGQAQEMNSLDSAEARAIVDPTIRRGTSR